MSARFAGVHSPPSTLPGVLPEGILQRWIRDSSSVVGDRRGCHYGDNLQDLFSREADSDKQIEILLAQVSASLNQSFRQGG